MEKAVGVINAWFPEKSFGFIHRNVDGRLQKYFFHVSELMVGTPKTGAIAKFFFTQGTKGKFATDVEVYAQGDHKLTANTQLEKVQDGNALKVGA